MKLQRGIYIMPDLLCDGEKTLAQIGCLVMENAYRSVGTGPGTLIATDKRLVYYTDSKMLGEYSLEFFYDRLKPIESRKRSLLGLFPTEKCIFSYEGTQYCITHIVATELELEKFINLVREQIHKSHQ